MRAPVRRAIIPAKRSNNSDRCEVSYNNVGAGMSLPSDMDDRVHNALLEELCADFGVTDSSYVDFLSFDIPTNRVQSGQLPADLEELGEMVSVGTLRPKSESASTASKAVRQTSSSSSRVSLVGPGATTIKPASGMQMTIPDDVASPTISSSCEESKPVEGGGEGLSDFTPNVHSTTGCASVKPETSETSGSSEDQIKLPPNNTDSVAKTKQKPVIPASTQAPAEHGTSSESERSDSSASSPGHVAKKARIIESGGDLLEDVKRSYAFVCGADMFAPPSQPAVSHPRLSTPIGSQYEPAPYSQHVSRYGTRSDGYENSLQYSVQNPGASQQQLVSDITYDAKSVNFNNPATPVKGYHQNYCSEWQASPASSINRSYHANVTRRANVMSNGNVGFQADGGQFMPVIGSDVRSSVPYAGEGQSRRTADFPGHFDQNNPNCHSVNSSPRSASVQSGRSYGYPVGSYGESYQLAGRQTVPHQNQFYRGPVGSPYHSVPSHAPVPALQHGPVTANDSGDMYSSGHHYPAQRIHPANVTTTNYKQQGDISLAPSPIRYRGQSVTPGFASSYPFHAGMENNTRETNTGNVRYTWHAPEVPHGRSTEFGTQQTPVTPGIQNNKNFSSVPLQNERTFTEMNTASDLYKQQGRFPSSPVLDHSDGDLMIPRGGRMSTDAELLNSASSSLSARQTVPSGCHSFVQHLIGSGSGPYSSHPLFPLLRDLVIADMNFEAPSFPYPLIAGLPKSFDRLISNYFSCTRHTTKPAGMDPSIDAIVMDALRYAHSALLGNYMSRNYVFIAS